MDLGTIVIMVVILAVVAGGAAVFFLRRRGAVTVTPEESTVPVRPAAAKKTNWSGGKTTSAGMVAVLEIIDGPDALVDGMNAGRKIEIYSGRVRLGRSPDLNDLQLYDIDANSTVSRRHCTIEFDRPTNAFYIYDEGSRSGTRVNERMIDAHQRYPLKDGDVIELGFVEQSGARLRFGAPALRARGGGPVPGVETSPVEVQRHGVVLPQDTPPEAEGPINPDELPGTATQENHPQQHGPISPMMLRPGTGPLGQRVEPCDVFLSYIRKDRDAMMRIRGSLRDNNLSVWTDENLTPGTPLWRQAIESAIEHAGCLMVILSPDAKQSPWVQRELDYATTQDKPIIPLLVRGDERTAIPLTLISAQWADLRENYETQIDGVLTIVRDTINQSKQE
ncbi:MAG: TIR domain-containing protein [Chloroflexi bacterium]|nr:TIR domain-containing protein [Chloroflexota bacterium]